jgi:hypothetical protein
VARRWWTYDLPRAFFWVVLCWFMASTLFADYLRSGLDWPLWAKVPLWFAGWATVIVVVRSLILRYGRPRLPS